MTVPTIGPSRVPIPPIKTMNIIATTQLGSNAKPGATYSVALKLTAPASPVPAADTTNDTISENTHIPIAKYASRSRKRKSAITAATPAQTSSASGSTQYGATLNDIDAKNNEYAPSPTNTCCPI